MRHVFFLLGFALAFSLLPPNMLKADPAKLLMPFFGLFMAGIIPAISLTINSVKSGGYSVKLINELSAELSKLLDYLQVLFVSALGSGITIVVAETVNWGHSFPFSFYTARIFNFVVGLFLGVLIFSLPRIRATFKVLLLINTQIATDEAAAKVRERATKLAPVSTSFPVSSEFGTVIKLTTSEEAPDGTN